MADTPRSVQDVLKRRQRATFVGRAGELALFRENLDLPLDDERRMLLFNVHGDGGMGKTFLLDRMAEAASECGWLTARADESAYTVVEAMAAIVDQLDRWGARLKQFARLHAAYLKSVQGEAGDGAADVVTKAATRMATGVVEALVPGSGMVTRAIDAEQVNQLRVAAADKIRRRDDARITAAPERELTRAFLEGLRELDKPVALFFDTYERTGKYLDGWLRALYDGQHGAVPLDLVVIVAGRDPLDPHRWAPYLSVVAGVSLTRFTDIEVRQLLAYKAVVDEAVIEAILAVSGGLPLAVATLATHPPTAPEAISDPSGGLVDRFLQWEQDPGRRAFALAAALARQLDEDVVAVLAGQGEGAAHYEWLRGQSFVSQAGGRLRYHDVVREPMVRLSRQRSPRRWRELHDRLAQVHGQRLDALGLDEVSGWADPRWVEPTLECMYHRACADPAGRLPEVLQTGTRACMGGIAPPRRWREAVAAAGSDTGDPRLRRLADDLVPASDVTEFAEILMRQPELPADALSFAYCVRGNEHRIAERLDAALADFDTACTLTPASVDALGGRGTVYYAMERLQESLADLSAALDLEPSYTWARSKRGDVLYDLGRYAEAVDDYTQCLAQHENVWDLGLRGNSYRLLGRHDQALADLTRAIELAPGDSWDLARRSETYRALGRPHDALADLEAAIAINPGYAWALRTRGEILSGLGRYDEAVAALGQALEVAPADAQTLALRGEANRELGRLDEAGPDFDQAIVIAPDYAWALARRADLHRQQERWEEALADATRAIDLAPGDLYAGLVRGLTHQALDCNVEAIADLTRVIEQDPGYVQALVARGHSLEALGRYTEAVADLTRAIDLDLGNGEAWTARGRAFLFLEEHHKAIADVTRAIDLNPQDFRPWVLRGDGKKALGQMAEALADLDRGLELATVPYGLTLRGEIYRMLGRREEAIADLNRAIDLDPESTLALGYRGELHKDLRRYDAALADFDRALALDPAYLWALTGRGDTYRKVGRWEEALADLNDALDRVPDDTDGLISRGIVLHGLGRYEEALADLDRAVALVPDSGWALTCRGDVYHSQGRYQEALVDATRAIELAPEGLYAFVVRGLAYRALDRHAEAVADLTRAIELDPGHVQALAARGDSLEKLDRCAEAVADLTRAIDMDPDNGEARTARGSAFLTLGEHNKAIADFTRAVELNPADVTKALAGLDRIREHAPDHADGLIARGTVLHGLGRYEEALADLDRAVTLVPDSAWALTCRGDVYHSQGRYQEALVDFDRALELDPANTVTRFIRGRAHYALGHFEEAAADYELVPDDADSCVGRGASLLTLERHAEAREVLTRAIELTPDQELPFALRGVTNHALRRYEEALADLDRAVELAPGDAWNLARRAAVHRAVGDLGKALADFDAATEISPCDELLELERRMTDSESAARRQVVVDLDATEQAWAEPVRDWLISTGVVTADAVSCEVSSELAIDQICVPELLDAMTCPRCEHRIAMRADGVATPAWDDFVRPFYLAQRWWPPRPACTSCGEHVPVHEWLGDTRWIRAHLMMSFWDQPPLTPEFLQDLSAHLGGHRLLVIE
ncbi:tetratricopeptide repeat protein [Nonomuraea sp. NPDC004186]